MSVYMTEAEQIAAIKKWWNKHSNVITIILSVILLSMAGYRYWHWHQDKVMQQASTAYENMMNAFSNQDNKSVRAYANQLINEYNSTVYADAARLTLAKLYVLKDKWKEAQFQLNYVADHSKMDILKQVAKIRLTRLLIAEKFYDKALSKLSEIQGGAYLPVINELKGDIFSATGKYSKAADAYHEAITEVQNHGIGNLFLEMKTNELVAMTHSKVDNKKFQHA